MEIGTKIRKSVPKSEKSVQKSEKDPKIGRNHPKILITINHQAIPETNAKGLF